MIVHPDADRRAAWREAIDDGRTARVVASAPDATTARSAAIRLEPDVVLWHDDLLAPADVPLLRDLAGMAPIEVVVVSRDGDVGRRATALEAGAAAFVRPGPGLDRLPDVLGEALRGVPARPPSLLGLMGRLPQD